ncbi:hypothetical protein PIB30_089576 [Stylosanthes scabra]|uniref:Uncharacterized protein n=1 Tax=Stylosanthes scabra TaxID=79078 RepID=A0ABU6VV50_9FABA|nr:hypothetical protein [Stylosanthes scabra]
MAIKTPSPVRVSPISFLPLGFPLSCLHYMLTSTYCDVLPPPGSSAAAAVLATAVVGFAWLRNADRKEKYEVLSLFRRYRASVRRKNVAIFAGMHRWYSRSRRIRLNRQLKTQPSLNPNSCPFPLLSIVGSLKFCCVGAVARE